MRDTHTNTGLGSPNFVVRTTGWTDRLETQAGVPAVLRQNFLGETSVFAF